MPNISQKSQEPSHLQGKKILLLVTQTKWGGAQKYVLELAKFLKKYNQVHIAFGETANLNDRFLNICRKSNIQTIPLNKLVRSIDLTKDWSAVWALMKILSQENYDLVHLNSSKAGAIGSLTGLFYALNPMNTRLRLVYTAHGFVWHEPGPKIQKKLYKISETLSIALQSLVIAVSDFDRQSAIAANIVSPNKIITIHNGINPADYTFLDKDQTRQKLGLSADKKYFGTIASFYSTKGYPYLVEALKILKDNNSSLIHNHQWIFIGEGPELEPVQKLIKKYDLENLIKIIPPQNDDWKYLPVFDYFVLPSVKEGLPYTILEAGLARVPIIASKVGGIPEIITDPSKGLLVAPANPLSLAQAMRRLAKDQDLSKQLSENNHKNILKNFNLDDTLRKTEEAYLRLF